MHNTWHWLNKYRCNCIINFSQQPLWPFFFLFLSHFTTDFTTGLQSKEYHEHCIHRNKQRCKTTQYNIMRRIHTTMSLSNLLQEFDVFTTRVKTKTVPSLSFSTSTLLVEIKSLRYNIIPFHQLLLVFLFFIVPELKFFTAWTRWKIRPKFSKFWEISCL